MYTWSGLHNLNNLTRHLRRDIARRHHDSWTSGVVARLHLLLLRLHLNVHLLRRLRHHSLLSQLLPVVATGHVEHDERSDGDDASGEVEGSLPVVGVDGREDERRDDQRGLATHVVPGDHRALDVGWVGGLFLNPIL